MVKVWGLVQSTLPPNFLPFAQVDPNIRRETGIDGPCSFQAFPNSKHESADEKYFWLKRVETWKYKYDTNLVCIGN